MNSQDYPDVLVNFVMTADGKVSTRNWTPSGFGSVADRKRLQEIRARGDALMLGRNTAEIDHVGMGISRAELQQARKAAGKPAEPLRVLVSGSGQINLKMKIFSVNGSPILIFTSTMLPPRIQKALSQDIIVYTLNEKKEVFLKTILNILYHQHQVRTLVCEGGPTLMWSLLAADLVTEVNLTITPLLFGGYDAPSLTGLPGNFLARPLDFQLKSMEVIKEECFLTYHRTLH